MYSVILWSTYAQSLYGCICYIMSTSFTCNRRRTTPAHLYEERVYQIH